MSEVPNLSAMVRDPDFQALPWNERHQLLTLKDPEYAALPAEDQAAVMNSMKAQPWWGGAAQPSPAAPAKASAPEPLGALETAMISEGAPTVATPLSDELMKKRAPQRIGIPSSARSGSQRDVMGTASPHDQEAAEDTKTFVTEDVPAVASTFGARFGAGMEQSIGGLLRAAGEAQPRRGSLARMAIEGSRPYRENPETRVAHMRQLEAEAEQNAPLVAYGQQIGGEGRAIAQEVEQDKPLQTRAGKILGTTVDSIGQNLPGMTATMLTGNPAIGLSMMGLQSFGQAYDEARAKGLSIDDATTSAAIQGGTEVATEMLPFVKLSKFLKEGKLSAKVLEHYLADMPGEHVATAIQNATGKAFDPSVAPEDRKRVAAEYLASQEHAQDQIDTFFTTLLQSGVMGFMAKAAQAGGQAYQNRAGASDPITGGIDFAPPTLAPGADPARVQKLAGIMAQENTPQAIAQRLQNREAAAFAPEPQAPQEGPVDYGQYGVDEGGEPMAPAPGAPPTPPAPPAAPAQAPAAPAGPLSKALGALDVQAHAEAQAAEAALQQQATDETDEPEMIDVTTHQGPWYWGGQDFDPSRSGTYISPYREYADKFASQTGGTTHEISLTPDVKIYPDPIWWQDYKAMPAQTFAGYDAVRVIEPNGQGDSLVVLNPQIFQAKGGGAKDGTQPGEAPAQEAQVVDPWHGNPNAGNEWEEKNRHRIEPAFTTGDGIAYSTEPHPWGKGKIIARKDGLWYQLTEEDGRGSWKEITPHVMKVDNLQAAIDHGPLYEVDDINAVYKDYPVRAGYDGPPLITGHDAPIKPEGPQRPTAPPKQYGAEGLKAYDAMHVRHGLDNREAEKHDILDYHKLFRKHYDAGYLDHAQPGDVQQHNRKTADEAYAAGQADAQEASKRKEPPAGQKEQKANKVREGRKAFLQKRMEQYTLTDKERAEAVKLGLEVPPAKRKQGTIGMKLESGEVVLTATGRETTPFPKVDVGSDRKTQNTLKRVDRWLMENALAEAEARGDDFNATGFRANLENPQQAQKDSAEHYLFGEEQPPVPKPFLKPLVPGEEKAEKAEPKPEEVSRVRAAELRNASEEATDIKGGLTGWKIVQHETGATLVHPKEPKVVHFKTDSEKYADVLRAKAEAQAYAQDNPVSVATDGPAPQDKKAGIEHGPAGAKAYTEAKERAAYLLSEGIYKEEDLRSNFDRFYQQGLKGEPYDATGKDGELAHAAGVEDAKAQSPAPGKELEEIKKELSGLSASQIVKVLNGHRDYLDTLAASGIVAEKDNPLKAAGKVYGWANGSKAVPAPMGAAVMAERQDNALSRFEESLQELGGISADEAKAVARAYLDTKIAGLDAVTGTFKVKHGSVMDREAIRTAARNLKEGVGPAPKVKATKGKGKATPFADEAQEEERADLLRRIARSRNYEKRRTSNERYTAKQEFLAATKALKKMPAGMLTEAGALNVRGPVKESKLVNIWLDGADFNIERAKDRGEDAAQAYAYFAEGRPETPLTREYFEHVYPTWEKPAVPRDESTTAGIKKVKEIVARAEEKSRETARKAAQKRAVAIDRQKDDIVVAISKLGGIDYAAALKEWGAMVRDGRKDLADHVTRQTRRFGHVFKKGGLSLDKMRETLVGHGYLQEGADINDLYEAIDNATRGNFSGSTEKDLDAEIEEAAQEYERQMQEAMEAEAEAYDFDDDEQAALFLLLQDEIDDTLAEVYAEHSSLSSAEFEAMLDDARGHFWREINAKETEQGDAGGTGKAETGAAGEGEGRREGDSGSSKEKGEGSASLPSLDDFEAMLDAAAGDDKAAEWKPSVGDTIYFEDAFDAGKRHPANFRGFDGRNAIVVWDGSQMALERSRIFKDDVEKKATDAEIQAEALRWQGAHRQAESVFLDKGDKKGALKIAREGGKSKLDTYLMEKFGIERHHARDITNRITHEDLQPDLSADLEDFAGQEWADAARKERDQGAASLPSLDDFEAMLDEAAGEEKPTAPRYEKTEAGDQGVLIQGTRELGKGKNRKDKGQAGLEDLALFTEPKERAAEAAQGSLLNPFVPDDKEREALDRFEAEAFTGQDDERDKIRVALNDWPKGFPAKRKRELIAKYGKPTMQEHIAAAIDAGADAIGELLKGITDPSKLGSGPTFDDETYQKMRPHLSRMWSEIKGAGFSFAEAAQAFAQQLMAKFGKPIKPFALKYYGELLQAEKEGNDVKRSGPDLERDSEDAAAQDALGEEDIQPRPGRDDGRTYQDVQDASGEAFEPGRDPLLPRSETLALGERGDQPVHSGEEESGSEAGAPGDHVDQRGGHFGDHGAPAESVAAGAVKEATRRNVSEPGAGDEIDKELPQLLPGQREDVRFAEARFSKPHGYGVLFTNGTGTGKTFSGLGVAKRFANKGKKNILIVAPSDPIIQAWVRAGRQFFDLDIRQLSDTKDNGGSGPVITTYANFGQNTELAKRTWDLIITDEAHTLSSNKDGNPSLSSKMLRAITLHPDGVAQRTELLHPSLMAKLEKAKAEGDKEGQQRLWRELQEKREKVQADVDAAQGEKRPRVVFLSATPFAYEKSVDYAEGYLFSFGPRVDSGRYNSGDARERFYMQHFGYRMRIDKLTEPPPEVDRGVMQRQFNSWLKKEGVLSGRTLDVDADYDRKFVLIDSEVGNKIDEGLAYLRENRRLSGVYEKIMGKFDHLSRRYLLEAIKAEAVIPLIKDHLKLGRQVVVFHDFNKGGGFNPFDVSGLLDSPIEYTYYPEGSDRPQSIHMRTAAAEFMAARPDLVRLPLARLKSPLNALTEAFPDILKVNGLESKKDRDKAIMAFQDPDHPAKVIIVQSDAGQAGISLHDTIGDTPRVLFNLGLPTKPVASIQQEGRIYRTGQASDAMFRYLNTGTSWERYAFATTIANRTSAAENLALGESARALRDAFIEAFQDSDRYPAGFEGEGKGGKERDRLANNALTEWDRAVAFYFGQKKGRQNDLGADYFATPEPLGLKMVEWAEIRPGDSVLEPSAGHGAIARWLPEDAKRRAIEPSLELASRAALVFDGDIVHSRFEDHNIINKYDAIVMNPPFGSGGRTAVDHLAKAAKHLKEHGRVVAIIPTGPAADKKFEKWLYEDEKVPLEPLGTINGKEIYPGATVGFKPNSRLPASTTGHGQVTRITEGYAHIRNSKGATAIPLYEIYEVETTGNREKVVKNPMRLKASYKLPAVTFERAGTGVMARVVILDNSEEGQGQVSRNFTEDETIKDFFDTIKDLEGPERVRPAPPAEEEAPAPAKGKKTPEAPKVEGGVTLGQFTHTQTGQPVYVATIEQKLSDEDYKKANTLARSMGGKYSGYTRGGAIRGFIFNEQVKRDMFVAALSGEAQVYSGAGKVEMPALEVNRGTVTLNNFGLQTLYEKIMGTKAATDATEYLQEAGRRIYQEGAKKYAEWAKAMQAFLKGEWSRFKAGMMALYQKVKGTLQEERGSVTVSNGAAAAQTPRGAFTSADEEVQQRRDAAHGLDKGPTLRERMAEFLDKVKRETQHFPELDMKRDARTADILRVYESSRQAATAKTVAYLNSLTKDLTAAEMENFEWRVLLDDLMEEKEKGRKLPFGYTPDVLEADHDQIVQITDRNPKIKTALERRQQAQEAITTELVDNGLLPESVLESRNYFRHMVLEYANARKWAGLGSKELRNKKRGWQKGRQGSELDINTNFLEAEFEVYSQQLKELATKKALEKVEALNDINRKLKAQAKAQNFEKLVGGPDIVRRIRRLEAEAAEIREGGSLDASDRQMLAQIRQELDDLDPTRPFKTTMAIGFSKLEKLARNGSLPDGGRKLRGIAEALANGEPTEKLFSYISFLAGNDVDAVAIPARMILKAVADLNKLYRDTLGEDYLEYRHRIDPRLIPEGYVEWQPEKGNVFYRETTLTEQIVDKAIAATWSLEELINSGLLKESVVMGGRKRALVLPEGVAKTLDNLRMERDTAVLDTVNKKLVGAWKVWTLLSPRRVVKYNLNNMSGDLDAALAADPKILKYMKEAFEGALRRNKANLTAEDEAMIDRGVLDSGISINEIPDINKLPLFKGISEGERHKRLWQALSTGDLSALAPTALITRYFDKVSTLTNIREALLREAAYRRALELLQEGKPVMWASKPEEIAQIPGMKDKAAKLARELIGDYGNISSHGERLRARYLPFWSWMEINAPRYYRIFRNAAMQGGKYSTGARIVGVAGKKFIGTTAGAVEKVVLTQMLFALVSAFNYLFHGDEDDDLDRNQLHIILGHDSAGNIMSLRFQGAFSDALSWFGLEDYPDTIKKLRDGSMDATDLARKMAMATPNKLVNAALPFAKLAGELITGKSLYPDILKPKPIRDKAEHAARFLSLENEYRAVAGKPTRGYLDSLKGILLYTTDPGEAAYNDIRGKVFDFLDKQGKDKPAGEPTARSNALYYYKQAKRFGDQEAMEKYLQIYKEEGGKHAGLQNSIKRAAPLAALPLNLRAEFRKGLTEADKKALDRANEWYRRVYQH